VTPVIPVTLVGPSPLEQAPITIRGEDIRHWTPHWRDGRPRRVELRLANGDVVLLDAFALRVLCEIYASLSVQPGAGGAT
jgi:hypothetical protein